ncbi:hypothetical protein SAMN05443550_105132 [Pedobacter hartonius]|uniref:Uncharacterized protein n=2 Tax=Pedobacter hartonius TaxID=425514 RepID=A0A1H4DWK8_9SPHI|nr:hypothetical protein SAMN05443550_105132 [Pedobacter hartonius]
MLKGFFARYNNFTSMSRNRSNTVNKGKEKSSVNPLVKMMADKRCIIDAIQDGKDLSTLKGIKIVSPI